MAKGIPVEDILKALPPQQQTELIDKLRRGGGVSVNISRSYRKRKHRWDTAEGKVISVRFTIAEFDKVCDRAQHRGETPGLYLKYLATRSHKKGGNSDE